MALTAFGVGGVGILLSVMAGLDPAIHKNTAALA
jgi:hypothetical protein